MSSLPPVLPPNSPRTSPLKKLPRSSPPPTHTRRNSIEEIFLQSTAHATATSETNLDRRHLEEILLENDPKKLVMELKRQCRSRDLIINTLRESYLRDVILLKEQIIARDQRDDNHQEHRFEQERTVAASSISIVAQENAATAAAAAGPSGVGPATPKLDTTTTTTTKRRTSTTMTPTWSSPLKNSWEVLAHHMPTDTTTLPSTPTHLAAYTEFWSQVQLNSNALPLPTSHIETNVPSVDFSGCLQFFAPKTHELMFKPCTFCQGSVSLQLIRNDDEIRILLEAQKIKLQKKFDHQMRMKEDELNEAKVGGKHMASQLLDDVKRQREEIARLRHDRTIAFHTVGELRKTKTYNELKRDFE